MTNRLILRNATVIDPSQGINERLDLLVEDGRVAALEANLGRVETALERDATGLVLAPGFIELHSHMREPGGEGSETIATGTRAAAAGGYTTLFCMPNTNPTCDTVTGVDFVLSRAATTGTGVRVLPVAAITRDLKSEDLVDFGALTEAGAGAFSDDGRPVHSTSVMRRALEYLAMIGMPIFDHCEDLALTGEGVMNEGVVSLRLGLKGIPRISESTIVQRDIALAAHAHAHIHICHVSTRESVEAIREGKRSGVHVTAEASPHHLLLTEGAVGDYDTHAKMKPPLCTEIDRQALVDALEDGTLDCVATDHAPHSPLLKARLFDEAPFGIIGMETAFPVLYTNFVATGRWTLDFLVERMSTAPARIMGKTGWGTLRTGAQADFTLIDTGADYVFTEKHIHSKSRNCPWIGTRMKARIAGTYVAGREIFAGQKG